MSWELTRREFIKGSIYFPSAVKAWMREQIDGDKEGDEQKVYEAFLPFVAAGARELSRMVIQWSVSGDRDLLHDTNPSVQPKLKNCDVSVVRLKGVGMPPVSNVLQPKGDDQVGITWTKSNLEPREVELTIELFGTYDDLLLARRFLVQRFSPINSLGFTGKMIFSTDNLGGPGREIYLRYRSGLEFDELDVDATEMSFPLRLWAQDPLFVDRIDIFEERATITTPPFNDTYAIENNGDWDVFPTLALISDIPAGGTLVDPLLENLTTGESIQINRTITIGQEISYILTYGSPDITLTAVGSILNDMDPSSDLGSFHIQPGSNNIKVTVGGASTGVAKLRIGWFNRYLSI